ncbi:MAG: amidohydrolase [Bacteroidales bacterium]|jgi:5-methylthioadenosine/S-adenosylhomocysteine deaminase|nr:amidohydrolase [Bacteroidales bacterium]
MNTILIKQVSLNGKNVDILIKDNIFKLISSKIDIKTERIIDGRNLAIIPPFYNMHSHAAMTQLRGFADDMPLFKWLNDYIWIEESKMNEEDIYIGTILAIKEMIHSGTAFFLDMYWFDRQIIRAVENMKIRANVGITFIESRGEKEIVEKIDFINNFKHTSSLINISVAPHAIYTCSKDLFIELHKVAKQNNLKFQTHLAETIQEVEDCKKAHNNLSPVEYLDSIGVLDNNTILAHCVHISEKDAEILSERGCFLIHNPCSNMKLSSGCFNTPLVKKYNLNVALGTDGASSNNNLSMIEEMKFAALLAKHHFKDPALLSAEEVFLWATKNGAKAVGINAGEIKEGMLADCLLIDLNNPLMQPNHNFISNMVYSADGSVIKTLICNGEILLNK